MHLSSYALVYFLKIYKFPFLYINLIYKNSLFYFSLLFQILDIFGILGIKSILIKYYTFFILPYQHQNLEV